MDAIESLAALRLEIDDIDLRILHLLSQRFAKTALVGEWNARIGESAVNSNRQDRRKELLLEACARHGLPQQMVFDIYARISQQVVAEHIAKGAPAAGRSAN